MLNPEPIAGDQTMAVAATKRQCPKAISTKLAASKALPGWAAPFVIGERYHLPLYNRTVAILDWDAKTGCRLLISDVFREDRESWIRAITLRRLVAGGRAKGANLSLKLLLGIKGKTAEQEGADDE